VNGPQPGTPEFWAESQPNGTAVIDKEHVLTYAEWNDRADRVAEGLALAGLCSGDRLGVRFRLGFEWFVLQRALQKLRVSQVAVNWRLTSDEASYIIRDSGARGLACDDLDPVGWSLQNFEILVTVGQDERSPGLRYEDLVETDCRTPRFGALWPKMILYTSGTTGSPRGVQPDLDRLDLDRLARYTASIRRFPPHPCEAVCLMTLPVHHGLGPLAATAACASGGTSILLDPYEPLLALDLIQRHRVQVWTSVPTMLLRLKSLPEEVLDGYDLSSLVALTTGAAPVPQSLKEWIVERFGDGVLWEVYGVSEVGLVTYAEPGHQLTRPGTSGLPFDGIEVAVVDDDWSRLPAGQSGEIAVHSPMMISRYLGRDRLGDNTVHEGFYRTGDIGHLDEDGFLFITDRIKDMIVAGGANIYPAEIEKVLVEHPRVTDAAVIGVPEDSFGEQPLAFIVAAGENRPSSDELVEFLEGRLASYKRPRQFVFVDELPMSPMGKVLKTELRAPYWEGRDRHV
jgi:long-chain acyl-CoA synthetase